MSDKIGVYILKSLKNNRYYIGSTNNLGRRLAEHKNSKVKATKYLLPLEFKFFQTYQTITEARKVEYKLKKLKRKDYIEKIIKNGHININITGP